MTRTCSRVPVDRKGVECADRWEKQIGRTYGTLALKSKSSSSRKGEGKKEVEKQSDRRMG